MRAIDTNVLVRLIVRDDPEQVRRAEAFLAPGAWISHLVLAEAVWVLGSVYNLSASGVATAVGMLMEHDQLALQDRDVVEKALQDFKAHPSVGFVDCLIVQIARKMGHRPMGTFDRSMSRLDDVSRL